MSLQTGVEVISLALAFNKATGIYGFLTILTGYVPSALQVTSYLISISVIGALAYLFPHIRKQSPFENLALGYLYAIETLSNIAYTTAFATIWYLNTVKHTQPVGVEDSSVDGVEERQAEAIEGNPDTAAGLVLAVAFTSVRIYFSLVVLAYARIVVQRHGVEESGEVTDDSIAKGSTPNPFDESAALGKGWRGKAGRTMVSFGRGYWLGGREEDEEWARHVGSKFRGSRR
ncbi:hypothetical protein OQA88_2182 [Cercophora sp. LCS_1]